MTTATVKLLNEVTALESELIHTGDKLALPAERMESWRLRLSRAPEAVRPAIKTQLIALAAKIMRETGNHPSAEPGLRQLCELATAVGRAASRPADGFSRSAAGLRLVAPQVGAKPPAGTFTVASLAGARRVGAPAPVRTNATAPTLRARSA